MSIFSFLKSKSPSYSDKVWKTSAFSLKGMMIDALQLIKQGGVPVITAHFTESRNRITDFLSTHQVPYVVIEPGMISEALQQTNAVFVLDAKSFQSQDATDFLSRASAKAQTHLFFFGHYPLPTKENKLLEKLSIIKSLPITFYSSLDDPAMDLFGGSRITEIMEKLGMKDDEPVEHAMVTKSMERARQKIEEKVTHDQPAESEKEWFQKNVRKV